MDDRDPLEGDELRADFNNIPFDEIEGPGNPLLDEVLQKYDCYDLLPLANRIIWLSSLKEVLGHVPNDIPIDYEELQLLVILQDEQNKKLAYENYKMREESKRQQQEFDKQQHMNDLIG